MSLICTCMSWVWYLPQVIVFLNLFHGIFIYLSNLTIELMIIWKEENQKCPPYAVWIDPKMKVNGKLNVKEIEKIKAPNELSNLNLKYVRIFFNVFSYVSSIFFFRSSCSTWSWSILNISAYNFNKSLENRRQMFESMFRWFPYQ